MNLRPALLALGIALLPVVAWGQSNAVVSHANGTTIVVQQDSNATLVGVELSVQAGLDRQTLAQNGLAALVAQSILETPVGGGLSMEDAIAAKGGSVHFTVEPSDVRFYVETVSGQGPDVLGLFMRALAAPDFSAGTVRAARNELVRSIANSQQEPLSVGIEMLDLSQVNGANSGLPLLGTPASLFQLGPSDASAFYRAYYLRGGSSVSAVGRVDAIGTQTLQRLALALPSGSTHPVAMSIAPLHGSNHQLVAHRDISAPWLVVQYTAPTLDSPDYGPMLVLSAFLQRTLGDIVEIPGTISPTLASHAVGTLYAFDRAPASLVLYVDGGIGDPNRTFGTALSVVNLLSGTKLQGSIDEFKSIAAGDFADRAVTLESQAWLGGAFARRTGSADYLSATLRAIAATTPADLQRVARRYLGNPTIALVLPRSGALQN